MPKNSLSLSVIVCLVFVFCTCPVLFFGAQGYDLETKMHDEYVSCLLLVTIPHCLKVCLYVKQDPLFLRLSMYYCKTHQSSAELQHMI